MLMCDLGLTFYLAVVILTLKILCCFLEAIRLQEVDTLNIG